jgi:hypothetical protein
MIHGEHWKMHDDTTIRRLDAAAVCLLTKGGARIEHDGLLDMLEGAGCRVDRAARRCYFTEKPIPESIACVGGKVTNQVSIHTGWNPQWHLGHGCIASYSRRRVIVAARRSRLHSVLAFAWGRFCRGAEA